MKMSRVLLLTALCYISIVTSVHGQNITYVKALLTQLFTTDGYDKRVRPAEDQQAITTVDVSLILNSIIELDEVEEKLVTTASLYLTWTDSNLVWDAAQYNGTVLLFVPQNDIWKPDVVLLNSVKDYTELGGKELQVLIYDDGTVNWYPIQKFESACSINIKYFPYDVQTCNLKFGAWSYTKAEVLLEGGDDGISLEDYSPNSAWIVENSGWNVEYDSGEASISFNIDLRRKPLFVLFTTIVPIVMLSFLNTLVFVLPNESGEKTGYAITVFLSLAVFLTIISATLPENSDSISIFSIYVTAQTVQSTLITALTLVMIRLSGFEDPSSIPGCLVKLTSLYKRIKLRKNKVCNLNSQNSTERLVSAGKNNDTGKGKGASNDKQEESAAADGSEESDVSWKEAMNMLDVLSFIFFTFSSFIITLVCLLVAKNAG